MDGKRIYTIQINGISESASAVESLNKQLDDLDKRIKELGSKNIKIDGGSVDNSAIKEQVAKQKELNQLKKEEAAQQRLIAGEYDNTMKGMKQNLADLKTVINATDLGDSDSIKNMTKDANALTNKLKEMEQAYGQFGRNVGNYQSALQGLDKLKIEVGGVTREFSSAREASRTLKNELTQLEIQGKSNTEEAKNLRKAYYQLQSAMDDATKSSKAMDEAMDWMTSFTAMASIGTGLKAFFGFDDNEITKSIQKLVALQSVLNGIESIRKQMDTSEGIGALLSKGSQGVDKFVASITGAEMGVNGLVKSSRLATVAVRSLSIALKGLGIGLIIAAITGLMQIVEKAGSAIQDYFKGNAELADASHVTKSAIDAENNALKQQRDIIATKYMKGYIDDAEYARANMVLLTGAILDNINAMKTQADFVSGYSDKMTAFTKSLYSGFGTDGIKVKSDFLDMTATIKNIEGAKTAWKDFARAVQKDEDVITANGANTIGELLGSFIITADDAKDDFVQIGQIIAGDWIRNIESINTATAEGKEKLKELVDELNNDEVTNSVMMNLDKYFPDEAVVKRINNVIQHVQEMAKSFDFDAEISVAGSDYWRQVRIDAMTGAEKVREQLKFDKEKELRDLEKYGRITDEHKRQIDEKYRRKEIEQTKQFGKERRDAENDLANLRIQAMKEGEAKELKQLDQERKEKIQKVVDSGILVGKRTEAINNLYDKKILDAKKKWAADILKTYEDLYQNIQQLNRATFNMEADTASQNTQNRAQQQKQDIGKAMINSANFDNSKTLEEYYKRVLEVEKEAADEEARINQERLDKELDYNKQEEELRHNRLVSENGEYKQKLEAGKITKEQYDKLIEDENDAHNARMNALDKEYAAQSKQTTQNQLQEQQRLYNEYYANIITDIKKDKQKIDEVMSKQPETDGVGWDVVLALKVKQTYRDTIEQYENLKKNIIKKQMELAMALASNRISPEDFAMRMSELKQETKAIDEAVEQVHDKQKQLVADFVQSIMPYVQAAMDSFNTIMNAVWDAQDIAFDKEQEQLDKDNEALDKALNKQQDIVEQHKEAIDSIEDELATARGSRRQHLIDQLNAEMEAQRAAQAEEKRIQKEKEANEKKQDALELKRKKAQYKRDLLQAVVNGAMAVTYAAMNKWPIPAVPLMALAGTTTAAQLAIMMANKPYRVGGQLEGGLVKGKRHTQGGVPVGNTGIEVEGDEMIIRRESTMPNIDLLNYINKSQRKLDLDDFIDFYSSGKIRKSITSMNPRTKYASGGVLPTLNNDYNFDDRLLTAFEDYSNRPIYVAVTEIENKMDSVRNVRALAGMREE